MYLFIYVSASEDEQKTTGWCTDEDRSQAERA